MEISNVAMSSQQTFGSENALSRANTKNNEQVSNSSNEEVKDMTKKNLSGNKENYSAVSRDGDTLTLSENLKSEGTAQKETNTVDGNVIKVAVKMTDAALSKCSGQKLRQLLQQGKISKQQYEKAMNKKTS